MVLDKSWDAGVTSSFDRLHMGLMVSALWLPDDLKI